MLVKCQKCGKKIEKDSAFRVITGKKSPVNKYYCSKQEYTEIIEKRSEKSKMYDLIYLIFNRKVSDSALYKEMHELSQVYSYEFMKGYIHDNFQYLCDVMNRDFQSDYYEIRYFSAILKNSLKDYERTIEKNDIQKIVTVESSDMKYKRNKKRKAFAELEQEVGET